jgi:hypothetical protein
VNPESSRKLQQFKKTLEKFCLLLREREVDKRLGISLKNPDEYTIRDVIQITNALQKLDDDSTRLKTCASRLRRGFRLVADNHETVKRLVSFVPNDIYGSIACGGFTLILGVSCSYDLVWTYWYWWKELIIDVQAMERTHGLRKELTDALVKVPEKLWEIDARVDIHFDSKKVIMAADSVFLALFAVLERMIDELTKGFARKLFSLNSNK